VSGRGRSNGDGHEAEYDLLTAALMGAVVGAGITFLIRTGPRGRPIMPALHGAGRGLKWAGRRAAKLGARGARWTADQGEELWDRIPRDEIERGVRRHMSSARDSIEEYVESELDDLRKAIRRRRRALGV
jgi:hypothetical protein